MTTTKQTIGMIVGSLAGVFSTVAITASAATITTAIFAVLISGPFVAAAFVCGARRVGIYSTCSTTCCLLSAFLVHTLPIQAEYILVSIYLGLGVLALALGVNFWRGTGG